MHNLEKILPPHEYQLWTGHLEKNLAGLKKESKDLLNQFISCVNKYDSVARDEIVLAICNTLRSEDVKINHVLFKQIILPNLLDNCVKGIPDYLRLLASFEQSIYSDNRLNKVISDRLELTEAYFDTVQVLELELKLGINLEAGKMLINKLAQQLDYALHELPIGLLSEVELMESLLERMTHLLEEYNLKNSKWDTRIMFIKSAVDEWKIYLEAGRYPNFEEHLKSSKSKASERVLNWNNSLLYDH